MNVDINKILELFIKYKTQVIYLTGLIFCFACFLAGRISADCPLKSDVCKVEFKLIKSLQAENAEKDKKRVQALNAQRDSDKKKCDDRVEKAKNDQRATNSFLECSDICALHPQCKQRGMCR